MVSSNMSCSLKCNLYCHLYSTYKKIFNHIQKLGLNNITKWNDKLLNKSIVLGDALISSNTMQINLNDNENKNSANDIVQTVVDNDIDFSRDYFIYSIWLG